MKYKVIHTWSSKYGKIGVRFENTKEKLETIRISPPWYFAIERKDEEIAKELTSHLIPPVEFVHEELFPEYTKVFYSGDTTDKGNLVNFFEENGIRTYEGDLMADRRWYIDKEISLSDKYRKLYFDIETDDTLEKIDIGRDRILSFAAIDDKGKVFFEKLDVLGSEEETDEAEEKLLLSFQKLALKYDILLGWNSSEFDVPYLRERMKRYKSTDRFNWKEIAKFDLLKRFRHIFRFDSSIKNFGLDNIAKHFLGKGKIPHSEKITELYKTDPKKLKEYNIEDSILVKELDEKLGVSDMMIRQSQWCGVPVGQFGLYSIIDAYIMKTAHRIGKFCRTSLSAIRERSKDNERGGENPDESKTKKKYKKDEAKYTGAIVLEPKVGRYKRVYTFDFKGLYPSMMRTSNIGYDSILYEKEDNCITNPGTLLIKRKSGGLIPTYFKKEKSVINLAITDLIQKRSEYKKLKLKLIEEGKNKGPDWERVVSDEIIVKELANSTYGIMGLEYGRYFSVDIAESITLFGQWCIDFAKSHFEKRGHEVIYGDTDSVFVHTGDKFLDIDNELRLFHEDLKTTLKNEYNIDDCYIELAFDKQYESFLLVAKKTYAGHVVNIEGKKTDDIYTRGLEYIKKNTFSFAAKYQKDILDLLIMKDSTKEEVVSRFKEIEELFYKTKFTKDELKLTQKVGKKFNEYIAKTVPVHVQLARELEIRKGGSYLNTEIEYIILPQKDGEKLKGVLYSEYKDEYDSNYYWVNKTKPVIDRIIEAAFPELYYVPPKEKKPEQMSLF